MRRKKFLIPNNREHGQSMIELGLSLVVLLILLSGVVDLGRAAFYFIAMRDSAQEGASFGSIFPNDCDEIENRVKAGLVDSNGISVTLSINGDSCKVCPDDLAVICPVQVGDVIEVIVEDDDFAFTMPILFGETMHLKTTIKDNVIRIPECACQQP